MNIFMTSGTLDFLKGIESKYPEETMAAMSNSETALLLHETNGETVFNEPRSYEVLDSSGNIPGKGFVVMNNIPVTDEGGPLFEDAFTNRSKIPFNDPGLLALRVLRPLQTNTYVIVTIWEKAEDYQNSNSLKLVSNTLNNKEVGIAPQAGLFGSETYTSHYLITG